MRRGFLAGGAAILVAAALAVPLWMAVDDDGTRRAGALPGSTANALMRLTISGINGDSPFVIDDFEWGVKSPRDPATGQATGKSQNQVLHVVREIDALSPALFNLGVKPPPPASAKLELQAPDSTGQPVVYMTYDFANASLASWKTSSSTEEIELVYQTVTETVGAKVPQLTSNDRMTVGKSAPVSILIPGATLVVPSDAASGLPTGKRQHKPFVVQHYVRDGLAPTALNAVLNNTPLGAVTIELIRTSTTGKPETYLTYRLTNAYVASLRHAHEGDQSGPMERLELVYESIEVSTPGGESATDSWAAPQA